MNAETHGHRLIEFENCRNFRHVGGYEGLHGAMTRDDRFFRSSHLAHLSEREKPRLLKLDVGTVIDLRRRSERAAYPNALPDGVGTLQVEIDVGSTKHFFQALQKGTTAQETHDMMARSYASYVTDMAPQFSTIFKHLADGGQQAVLVHCMVGKDRTGIASALLLALLGVHHETIVDDYLLSNEFFPQQLIVEALKEYLQSAGVKHIDQSAMKPFCTVHADYLEAAFRALDTKHGGCEKYFNNTLGLSDAHIQSIRQRFLVEVS